MFDFEKTMKSAGKTKEQIHVEEFFKKWGQDSGSRALEIEERVKAKNRKPVFKHISEYFEYDDSKRVPFGLLCDDGKYCFFVRGCTSQDIAIYYVCKDEFAMPAGAFDALYSKLSGREFLITQLHDRKYPIFVPDENNGCEYFFDFVNRFPPVEKSKKPKAVIKKDDDEKNHDASYRQFFTPSI